MAQELQLKLVSNTQPLCTAWAKHFADEKDVEIVCGNIITQPCDAMVSPANSFGFMDGGLDYQLSVRFGWDLEKRLQAKIKQLPERELLIGKAMVIATEDVQVPYLISAPTMRIPTNFNIPTSINAYLAMKALLIAAQAEDAIRVVAIPGLCTGTGGMKLETAAFQMYMAYSEVVLRHEPDFKEFGDAQRYQWKLNEEALIWTH